ncbi:MULTISPECIES: GGDEF domain-containing protein [Delftia]|uniref:diguanylate cyclase n=1 Tax=Delftia lacustris TaxID=558537 RepID=A0A1H3SG22_9BURK|nr:MULTISPECIES: GGDEF domain-containing protein [Delftia]EPD43244.1 hypothetical protein HMPREF9701_00946 [Delftia acidovorans CCUG 274B]SDZ36854.1 diguanylate cyclase (GGDEF) domain-containing protein [Delftia lacustris]
MASVDQRGLPGSGRQHLEKKFSARVGLTLFTTSLLVLAVIAYTALDFAQARQNLSDLQHYRSVLDTADLIAAERAPANVVMSEEPFMDSPSTGRLKEVRRRVDARIAQLTAERDLPWGVHTHEVPPQLLASFLAQMAAARAKVDRLAVTPRTSMRQEQFRDAVEGMFKASNSFRDIVTWSANELVQHQSHLSGPGLIGQMLSDLRDQGGRMGSQVIAAVATHEKLPLQSVIACRQTQGRLFQLWQSIRSYPALDETPALAELRQAIEREFFGTGFRLIDDVITEGRQGSNYPGTAASLTDRFVPTMQPIGAYRNSILDAMVARFERARDVALAVLVATTLVGVAIVSILIVILRSIKAHVFRPLLEAHDAVVRLADEHREPLVFGQSQAGEVAHLFRAIEVLQRRLAERASATNQLRVQAETDSLTGLLNRRQLDRLAQAALGLDGKGHATSLVLLDIDRFKTINDTYGHATGDRVLVQLAQVLRTTLRANDTIARFGGEEFAILLPGVPLPRAVKIARKIRLAVRQEAFTTMEGQALAVTASFGVALVCNGETSWQHLIESADTALYRAKSDGRNRVRFTRGDRGAHGPTAETARPDTAST